MRGGAWWGAGGAYALKAGEATTTAKKNLSVDGMAEIMVRHPSHDAYPSRCRGLFLGFHSLRPPRVVVGWWWCGCVVVEKVVVVVAVVVRAARVSRARALAAGASGRQ